MLDTIRLIVAIMFGLSLIIVLMDMYHVANVKLNDKLKAVVYLIYAVCSVFLSVDSFVIWYKGR